MATLIKTKGTIAPKRWLPAVARGLIGAHFFGADAASSVKNWADRSKDAAMEGAPVYGDGFTTFNGAVSSQSRMLSKVYETAAFTHIFLMKAPETIPDGDWPTLLSNGPGASGTHTGNSTGLRAAVGSVTGNLTMSVPGWNGTAAQTTNVVMTPAQGAPTPGGWAIVMFRSTATLAEIVNLSNGKRKPGTLGATRDPSTAPFYIGDTLDPANTAYDGTPTISSWEAYGVDLTNDEALAAAAQMQAYASLHGIDVLLASSIL